MATTPLGLVVAIPASAKRRNLWRSRAGWLTTLVDDGGCVGALVPDATSAGWHGGHSVKYQERFRRGRCGGACIAALQAGHPDQANGYLDERPGRTLRPLAASG